jgi:hypothetical protein
MTAVEVGTLLRRTSSLEPTKFPLDETWMVDWSRFFEAPATTNAAPNFSQLITPALSTKLQDAGLFGAIDETPAHGLAYRDLMSAALAGLWSVGPLITAIGQRRPAAIAGSALLADGSWRVALRQQLGQWTQGFEGVEAGDLDTLAAQPPLPFFVLFEAMAESGGARLGSLGSLIVGDVLYAALADGLLEGDATTDLAASVEALNVRLFGTNALASLSDLSTMPRLIAFIGQHYGWRAAEPVMA